MKIITLTLSALLFAGCAKTLYIPVERTRTITETIHDTVIVTKLEKETTKQTVKDTTSKVETKYASSTATWHGTSGELEHEITTKDTPFEIRVQYLERVVIDSIPVPYPVEIEKLAPEPTRLPLRWWEQALVWLGIAALTLCVVKLISKRFGI